MATNHFFKILLGLSLALSTGACRKVKYEKDAMAYYPKVSTERVQIQPDGSVEVSGVVHDQGSGSLYFAGFCMDKTPNPEMHINQQLAPELIGNRFSTIYKGLDAQETYHVRSFAVNEFGYSYGEDMVIERPGMDTNIIACHPGTNQIIVERQTGKTSDNIYTVSALDPERHNMSCNSYNSGFGLRLQFGRRPTTGKYTIWERADLNSNQVEVLYSDQNTSGIRMDNGGELYVQQLDATRYRIWICSQACGQRVITACFNTK